MKRMIKVDIYIIGFGAMHTRLDAACIDVSEYSREDARL